MKSKSFTILTEREVKAVKRGLGSVQAGLHLIAAIMATSLIKTAVRKAQRKTKAKRKVRLAHALKLAKGK